MSFQEKMQKSSSAKTVRPPVKKRVVLKREEKEEEEESSSKEEESLVEETEEEEEKPTPKKSQRKLSSPSKRSTKTRAKQALLGKNKHAPKAQVKHPYIVPDRPSNIVWVVKTETLAPPVIDPANPKNHTERYLTAAEIAWIVDVIPMVPAAIAELGMLVQQQIKNVLTLQLMREKIIPLGINILRAEIEFHFYKGLVEPGKTIGVTCAESVGQPLTQITLSSFHQTGSATAGVSGVDSISEMFNISPERKNEFTTIHFKDKDLTYDEAFAMRRKITGVSLHDLVEATAFIPVDDQVSPYTRGWWYNLSEQINEIDMGEESVIMTAKIYLRLVLSKQQLHFYNITTKEVARIIAGVDDIATCVCVYSPTATGVIDIYPSKEVGIILHNVFDKRKVKPHSYRDLTGEPTDVLFLQYIIVNKMPEIIIKGVPGIKDIIPSTAKIPSYFKHNERIVKYDKEGGVKYGLYEMMTKEEKNFLNKKLTNIKAKGEERNVWVIWFDDISLRIDGVPHRKVEAFITACGMNVLYMPPDIENSLYQTEETFNPLYSQYKTNTIYVYVGEDYSTSQSKKIDDGKVVPVYTDKAKTTIKLFDLQTHFKFCVDKAALESDNAKRSLEVGKVVSISNESSLILKHSVYIFGEARGINMQSLLSNPYIDPSRCRCNNFHQMLEAFDIEVIRNAYIREFYEHIVNNNASISPRYLILIAEFVTNQGFLIPITSRGVSRQNIGSFAKASFEHAMPTINTAAAFRKEDTTKDTSTSIFIGRRAPIGTGLCQPVPDEIMLEENKLFEETNIKMEIDKAVEDVTGTLGELDFAKSDELFGVTVDSEAGDDFGFAKLVLPEAEKTLTEEKFPVWPKNPIPIVKLLKLSLPDWVSDIYEGKVPVVKAPTTPLRVHLKTTKPLPSKLLEVKTSTRKPVSSGSEAEEEED